MTTSADVHEHPGGAALKIWFKFVPRDGWLPYDTEGLWATQISPDTARIDNVPFLQDGIAQGDIVRFQTNADGRHWALTRIQASGHGVIRVIPVPSGPLGRDAAAVYAQFTRFSLGCETFGPQLPLVAFDVPTDADFAAIKHVLDEGASNGWWHFEVGSATDRWWNA